MTGDAGLILRNGLVFDPASGSLDRKDILIDRGTIGAVADANRLPAGAAMRYDARDRLIVPGFVNAHTHGHANLVKGVARAWTLEMSLTNGPWLAGPRTPDMVYLSTLLGAIDMLSKGCTACFDLLYEFPHPTVAGVMAAARAYADAGMRALIAPMIADKTIFQAIPGLLESLPPDMRALVGTFELSGGERCLAAVEEIARDSAAMPNGTALALAPTIPHHCSEPFLKRCMAIADRHGLPLHMHIAESRLQAVAARKLYGRSAVRYLADIGMLRPGFAAAHGVWLDENDLDLLAEYQCSVIHIPASNLRLGSGIAHLRPVLDRGINVALATDGANSSDSLSMLQAMRLASLSARAFADASNRWLGPDEIVGFATLGGAKVMGLPGGAIAAGANADLVMFDLQSIDFIPCTDAVNQLVTCAEQSSVVDVMVGGEFKVRNRKVVSVDISTLGARVSDCVANLHAATRDARKLAGRLEPHVVAFAQKLSREPLPVARTIAPNVPVSA